MSSLTSSSLAALRLNNRPPQTQSIPYSETPRIAGEYTLGTVGPAFGYYEPPYAVASMHPAQDEAVAKRGALQDMLRDAELAQQESAPLLALPPRQPDAGTVGRVGIVNVTFRVGPDLAVTATGDLVRLKRKSTNAVQRLGPLTRIYPEGSPFAGSYGRCPCPLQ
jgi:hypothetical protein